MNAHNEKRRQDQVEPQSDGGSPDAVAVVHAPETTKERIRNLVNQLHTYIDGLGLSASRVFVNPTVQQWRDIIVSAEGHFLVLGWGTADEPNWPEWLQSYGISPSANNIVALDLIERAETNRRSLAPSQVDSDISWKSKSKQWEMLRFINGYFVGPHTPFALKRVVKAGNGHTTNVHNGSRRVNCVLEPGKPEEIEIVRLIFRLYVQDGYIRSRIVNLLNSERIKPPRTRRAWRKDVIDRILSDPVYIGSNRYAGCVLPDVFPPIIDKALFHKAQTRLYRERIATIVPPTKRGPDGHPNCVQREDGDG